MKLKRNDNVKVIAGKERGKTGKVIQVFPASEKLVIEGVNMLVKNMKARAKGEKGQKISFAAPMKASNVLLVCPKCSKPIRVKYIMTQPEEGKKRKKLRVCRKCSEVI